MIIRETIKIPLVRVTKTKIYQRLDIQARFEKKIDKFPQCKGLLQVIRRQSEKEKKLDKNIRNDNRGMECKT